MQLDCPSTVTLLCSINSRKRMCCVILRPAVRSVHCLSQSGLHQAQKIFARSTRNSLRASWRIFDPSWHLLGHPWVLCTSSKLLVRFVVFFLFFGLACSLLDASSSIPTHLYESATGTGLRTTSTRPLPSLMLEHDHQKHGNMLSGRCLC